MDCVGQRLCRLDSTHTLGKGTYKRQDYIYSSLAGIVNIDDTNKVNKCTIKLIKKKMIQILNGSFRYPLSKFVAKI